MPTDDLLLRQLKARPPHEQSSLLSDAQETVPRSHHHETSEQSSVRQDIWTVLRYRTSIVHRSFLQTASYVLEVCILCLILMNVVMVLSQTSVAPDTPQGAWYRCAVWLVVNFPVSTPS